MQIARSSKGFHGPLSGRRTAPAPNRRRLLADIRVVRLLKVATSSRERRQHRGGNLRFENWLVDPPARPDVNEIDGGARIVVEQWSLDTAEPIETVGVASPHERSVGHVGEPRDAAIETLAAARVTEANDSDRKRAIDRRSRIDVVAAGPHRCAVDLGHARYSAPDMETFKRYLLIQAMMFVFGIVGPIFLIMFFASPRDPELRWAYWAGLFITVADILIALALTAGSGDKKKAPKDVKIAMALQKRKQSGRSGTSGSSSSLSSSDPFFGGAVGLFSTDSGSSSGDSGWSSSDSGSSSSDSGSSSSDSGSSSSV